MDAERIAQWRTEGMSDAEIGRRLGVTAERLRELLGEPSSDEPDDNGPNTAGVR